MIGPSPFPILDQILPFDALGPGAALAALAAASGLALVAEAIAEHRRTRVARVPLERAPPASPPTLLLPP